MCGKDFNLILVNNHCQKVYHLNKSQQIIHLTSEIVILKFNIFNLDYFTLLIPPLTRKKSHFLTGR